MTNYAGMAAPFAAAVVSASKGLTTLTNEYMAGSISSAEYFDLGMCLCAESAIVGLATAAGQAVIVTEAMKMESEINTNVAGSVISVSVTKGDRVTPGEVLMEIG